MIPANKIAFVGDLHLDTTTPSSRVDDYSDSSLAKLMALKNTCLLRDIKIVVLTGDVFNKHDQSNTYMNRVLKVFREFKENNILVFSIFGNHDLSFERMDTAERSPLQMLITSGLVVHLSTEMIKTPSYSVQLVGLDYPDNPIPVSDLPQKGTINILVAHRFYNYGFNDPYNLTTEDCVNLGYNAYALGHDHIQYDIEKTQFYWVIRPGSFMRTSSHLYNMSRQIVIDVIDFKGTEEQPQFVHSREIISSRPSSEVFSSSVHQRREDRDITGELDVLHERVGNMLRQMEVRTTGLDPFKVLDEICTDPEIKACVESYLRIGGYERNEESILG